MKIELAKKFATSIRSNAPNFGASKLDEKLDEPFWVDRGGNSALDEEALQCGSQESALQTSGFV